MEHSESSRAHKLAIKRAAVTAAAAAAATQSTNLHQQTPARKRREAAAAEEVGVAPPPAAPGNAPRWSKVHSLDLLVPHAAKQKSNQKMAEKTRGQRR